MSDRFATHDVTNQSPLYENINLFTSDRALEEAVQREGAGGAKDTLAALGAAFGSAEAFEFGRLANENPPVLKTHDMKGRRRDVVEFHPAYHALMQNSMAAGLHTLIPDPGANVARAAGLYMAAQMEAGHCCPITMTNAARPVLRAVPELASWLEKGSARVYDPAFKPMAEKASVTFGMGMTEKQGGTDVRANTTRAEPAAGAGSGAAYRITGHKWFMSAPMSDAFLVLAQATGGLTCFLMPRFCPDGSVNGLAFQRLKPKLGNRSNASSEVEFHDAHAWAVGDEGRGVATIIEMVMATRLDCAVSSAGMMRFALANALSHTRSRTVFQKKLADQPLMREVLADMALDVEAAVALSFRLARAFDRVSDPAEAAWRRVMTPVTKYWVTKIAPGLVAEAMECMGGNGYVEELPLARLYREVPVNAIWEGSGNVMALDLLRVLERDGDVVRLVLDELSEAVRGDAALAGALSNVETIIHQTTDRERDARFLTGRLAVLAAGALLRVHAPAAVADAFVANRVLNGGHQIYGAGLAKSDSAAIARRAALPVV